MRMLVYTLRAGALGKCQGNRNDGNDEKVRKEFHSLHFRGASLKITVEDWGMIPLTWSLHFHTIPVPFPTSHHTKHPLVYWRCLWTWGTLWIYLLNLSSCWLWIDGMAFFIVPSFDLDILYCTWQAVADIIRTTLGPRSMLKMLLDAAGGVYSSHFIINFVSL